ncbi:MAG: hypothetical protein HUU55_10335 [Myxococcales bacterium]|nr:hypothetical protein [Myxococcales bacterium]
MGYISRVLSWVVLATVLFGCDYGGGTDDQAQGDTPLAIVVAPLESACAGTKASAVDSYRVCGQAPLELGDGTFGIRKLFDKSASPATDLFVRKIPVNDSYEVTVVGFSGGQPAFLSRRKNVKVSVDKTTDVDMVLVPYNQSACLSLDAAGKPNHRLFSAAVELPDGRVFVTGGFTGLVPDGQGSTDKFLLASGSKGTYFIDPATGQVSKGPELLEGRGAHAVVYVPALEKAVVLGGASELLWRPADADLALKYDSKAGLNTVEIIDFKQDPPVVTQGQAMMLKRVFPVVNRIGSEEIVITGGGRWPNPESDYKDAEFFNVATSTIDPTILASDFVPRSGHTMTFVKNENVSGNTIEVYLLWGGSLNDPKASLLRNTRTSGKSSVTFADLDITGDIPERTYFHSMTALGQDRFLALGGVALDSNKKLTRLENSFAYLITYTNPGGNSPTLAVSARTGFPNPRIFHTATSHDGKVVTIVGGFLGLNGSATDQVAYFDADALTFASEPQPTGGFAARAGHVALSLKNDALYLGGGISAAEDLTKAEQMLSELIVPGMVRYCDALVPVKGEGGN